MVQLKGFSPSSREDARALILGSMPGSASLNACEYYAHPRNSFWPIMGDLLGVSADGSYQNRLESLKESGVALWDVVHKCVRSGSLDNSIKRDSVIANDFTLFFAGHPGIVAIFFNGSKAETLFNRLVLPGLPVRESTIFRKRLPSTSPAHAAMTYKEKLSYWATIKQL